MFSSTKIFSLPVAPPLTTQKVIGYAFRFRNLPGMENFPMGNNKGEEESYEDEQPRHPRNIAPFALAEHPVTQALWAAVFDSAKKNGLVFSTYLLRPNPSYFSGATRPVESVSWDDAHEFCRVLNELLGKPAGHFRLPSEAEWEYAARAGTRETLYAGSNQLAEVGWYDGNNKKETVPVGQLAPNAFGLYDLSGNVFEWCEDDWQSNYKDAPLNGTAWKDGETKDERAVHRVRRGGSWFNYARFCRCAYRYYFRPGNRGRYFGFRLAAPVQV
jgi:formylglycine-generating enzyme required for sulfatase activity